MSEKVYKVTSAWRGKGGKFYYKPLNLEPKKPEDFFDGYLLEEFDEKCPNPLVFPLPVNFIGDGNWINQFLNLEKNNK